MTNITANDQAPAADYARGRRLITEAKSSLKTTEFWVYIAVVLAIIVTSMIVGDNDSVGEGERAADLFDAAQAMMYITWATIGYMVSRGLAKSGSRETYTDK